MPLRSESSGLYSFVLDLSADGNGAKEPTMNVVANAQVQHRRQGHLHAWILNILRIRNGTGSIFDGTVSDYDVYAARKAQQLAHRKVANNKVNWPFQLCYGFFCVGGNGWLQIHQQDR